MTISIKKRLLIAIAGLSIIYFVFISALFLLAMNVLKDKSVGYVESVSKRYVERVALVIREKVRALEGLGTHLRFRGNDEPHVGQRVGGFHYPSYYQAELVELFTQYQHGMEYETFMLLDEKKSPVMYFERGYLRSMAGTVPTEISRVVKTLHEGKYSVVAKRDGKSFYILYAPYPRTNEGEFMLSEGVKKILAIEYKYDIFRRIVDEIIYNEENQNGIKWGVAFLGPQGRELWSSDANVMAKIGVGRADLQKGDLMDEVEGYYVTVLDVPHADWQMVLAVEEDPVFSSVTRLYLLGVLIMILGVVVLLLCINYMDKRISRPLKRLTEATKQLGDGNYDVHLPNPSEDEIGVLGKSFVEMSQRIQKYQEQVSQNAALAAVGEISAQVAHDMRSPLSVLTTFVKHYEARGDSEEREFAGAASRSVKKLLHMADDFLDYGKAKTLSRITCNLKQIFYEFVEPECSKTLRDKGLSIDLNIDPHLYANIDSHKISRTMTNLVLNAARAVDEHDGRIEVGVMEGQSGELIIIVSDDGCGIPRDDLEKIYESFYSTDKKLGTGLGLSYCKQVVEVHDGTMDVQSEVDKGTIFTIMLPDCVVSEVEVLANISADTAAGAVVVKKRTGVPGPEKVLIVDDDEDIRMQWERLIDERGGRIIYSASSVREAQSSLGVDYTMIDTAIVDYEYAGEEQNGVDLVAFLKRNGVKTVYLCTGHYQDEEVCRRAKEAGAESVLSKPIDDNEVSAIFS